LLEKGFAMAVVGISEYVLLGSLLVRSYQTR